MIRVGVDCAATLRALQIIPRQIQYATAQALNDTAFEARDTERNTVEGRMMIRRPWVLQGIQVPRPFATRDNLQTAVEVEGKRDFLNKFEDGGTKRPTQGRTLAVPDEDAFARSRVIPKGKRPKAFEFKLHRTKSGKVQFKGEQRTFLIEKGTFEYGAFQRFGRGKRSDIRLLWWFTRAAQIEPILRFERTVKEVVTKSYTRHFNRRFIEALRTAR